MVIYETRIDVRVKDNDLLAALMVSNGYTVRELAGRVGVSRSTIGHLRSGERKYVNKAAALKIAKALRITPSVLFDVEVSTVYREVQAKAKGRAAA